MFWWGNILVRFKGNIVKDGSTYLKKVQGGYYLGIPRKDIHVGEQN